MTEEQLEMKMAQIEEDYESLLSDDAVDAIEVNESELSSSHKKLEKPISPKSE